MFLLKISDLVHLLKVICYVMRRFYDVRDILIYWAARNISEINYSARICIPPNSLHKHILLVFILSSFLCFLNFSPDHSPGQWAEVRG